MDKQSLHETAKRLALELPFVELCWPFGPEFGDDANLLI